MKDTISGVYHIQCRWPWLESHCQIQNESMDEERYPGQLRLIYNPEDG